VYPRPPFSRDDFLDGDDYLRALREGGFEPTAEELRAGGSGPNARLLSAIFDEAELAAKRKPRVSTVINSYEIFKVYSAVAFSNRQGVVLNVHLTIVWSTVRPGEDALFAGFLQRFQELARKWCIERQLPFHGIYCWENGTRNGLHSHILMHVPRLYADHFRRWADKAIKTTTGKAPVVKKRSDKKPSTLRIVHRRETEIRTQWHLFRYLMKGVWLQAGFRNRRENCKPYKYLGLFKIAPRAQGLVTGKRVGVFRAIDDAAQKRAGFDDAYERLLNGQDPLTDEFFKAYQREEQQRELASLVAGLVI
jgi:hypothetical protein